MAYQVGPQFYAHPTQKDSVVKPADPKEIEGISSSMLGKAILNSQIPLHLAVATAAGLVVRNKLASNTVAACTSLATLGTTIAARCLYDRKTHGQEKLALELSALTRLGGNNFHRITNFATIGLGDIYLGGLPNSLNGDLTKMVNANIHCVIDLVEDWEGEKRGFLFPYTLQDYEKAGIEYFSYPTKDHQNPSDVLLSNLAQKVKEVTKQRKNVLIHCRAGVSRSAKAVYWALRFGGINPENALQLMSVRKTQINSKKGLESQAECNKHPLKDNTHLNVLITPKEPEFS